MSSGTEHARPAKTLTLTLRLPRRVLLRVALGVLSVPLLEVALLSWFESAPPGLSLVGGALLASSLAALDAFDKGELRLRKIRVRPEAQHSPQP